MVEEIGRSFWGNEKWGWGPTGVEHSQAKLCNTCNFLTNIFSCRFDAQRLTCQREKKLLAQKITINSTNSCEVNTSLDRPQRANFVVLMSTIIYQAWFYYFDLTFCCMSVALASTSSSTLVSDSVLQAPSSKLVSTWSCRLGSSS